MKDLLSIKEVQEGVYQAYSSVSDEKDAQILAATLVSLMGDSQEIRAAVMFAGYLWSTKPEEAKEMADRTRIMTVRPGDGVSS